MEEKNGSQATHGNAQVELVDVHLQLGSHSGTSVDERPAPRDGSHMDRYFEPWEDSEGHLVDPIVDEGLNSTSRK